MAAAEAAAIMPRCMAASWCAAAAAFPAAGGSPSVRSMTCESGAGGARGGE
jgi:hypothetical protein